jgi:nitronate monooxygenase
MSNQLRTPICERLGIRVPIIQAPMAGGPSTPELVAAVGAAGALGSFGFAYTSPDAMKRDVAAMQVKTNAPFNLNLFGSPQPGAIDPARQRGALDAVAAYYAELGLPPPEPVRPPYAPDLEAQIAAAEEIKPPVLTLHLGKLPAGQIRRFQSLGTRVGGTATCIAEAEQLEALGADFIIAQGAEAGGHRGTYLRDPYEAMTGTIALVRMVVRRVSVPVVAAGGIMDGAGIAAALALGAQAVQLGTAFVPCPESGAPPVHKARVLAAQEDETLVTEKFSGKPSRGLANRFIREMAERAAPQLPFPAQNTLTGRLRTAAAQAGHADFVALWAGQAAALARALPAAELVATLEAEALEALEALGRLAARHS